MLLGWDVEGAVDGIDVVGEAVGEAVIIGCFVGL
jgi:hypothetical protein